MPVRGAPAATTGLSPAGSSAAAAGAAVVVVPSLPAVVVVAPARAEAGDLTTRGAPPPLAHGTFVCGMFTPGESVDYIWPVELKAELKQLAGGYRADPYADGLQGHAFVQQTHEVIRQQDVPARYA